MQSDALSCPALGALWSPHLWHPFFCQAMSKMRAELSEREERLHQRADLRERLLRITACRSVGLHACMYVLYCIVLWCVVSCCVIVLRWIVLCRILCCVVSSRLVLYGVVFFCICICVCVCICICIILCCTVLYCVVFCIVFCILFWCIL